MKHILITISIFVSTLGYAQSNKLIVNVTNFKNNHGKVMIGIYNGQENFMKKSVFRKSSTIQDNSAKVVFENLPSGEYAISLYHDENENNKLDTGWFGIPNEGYGCSNNAKGMMGPPKYEVAKFQLKSNKEMTIKIN